MTPATIGSASRSLGIYDSPVAGAEGSQSAIGDLIVTFGDAKVPPPRISGVNWQKEEAGDSSQVWQAPPSTDWPGSPAVHIATHNWSAWLMGELYGTVQPQADILNVLEGHLSPNNLNGHFILFAFDKVAGRWHVWTNRYATFHAYYATDGRRSALGTAFRGVAGAAARSELDWEGITSFFALGYFAADRTYLADVVTLRPATHYEFDARGEILRAERYWHWWFSPDPVRSRADTVDEFGERFQIVMDNLLSDDRIAIPISGGLDSRSTVAAINRGKQSYDHLWAYSYGYSEDSVETRIAGQVAAAVDIPFNAYLIEPYLFQKLPRVMSSIEGFQDVTQARQAAVVEEIARRADTLLAAHWGDVFLDDMGVAKSSFGSSDPVKFALYKFQKPGSDWLLTHICQAQLSKAEPSTHLREMLAAEVGRIGPISDPDFLIKALKTDQWSARWTTASIRMFQAAAYPRLPFYDTRLADFFHTVPTTYVAGRRLQIDYLKRFAPDLARIPWQVTGRPLTSSGGFSVVHLVSRVARKGRTIMGRRRPIERNWEIQFLNDAGRAALSRWLLQSGLLLHEFVGVETIRELLEGFYRDPWSNKCSYPVAMLLTFSAWLNYMDGRPEA